MPPLSPVMTAGIEVIPAVPLSCLLNPRSLPTDGSPASGRSLERSNALSLLSGFQRHRAATTVLGLPC